MSEATRQMEAQIHALGERLEWLNDRVDEMGHRVDEIAEARRRTWWVRLREVFGR